jgi:hypothetical protein
MAIVDLESQIYIPTDYYDDDDDDDDDNNNNKNNNNNKIRDNKQGTCMLIDVAITGGRNVMKKESENILKYKYLTIEIQLMWMLKAKVIPVIIGAAGTVSDSLRQNLSNIPGKHEIKQLQKKSSHIVHFTLPAGSAGV